MIVCDVTEVGGRIERFRLRGHAGYAEAGSDIVCAAVSALVTNAVNSCEGLLKLKPNCEDDGNRFECRLGTLAARSDVQLLFRSMVFGLQQISEQYPKHVKVRMRQEEE
ncbi:MAG: ribosomal-processing cysteine protease Prp [Alicyclobacillus herbarius]|uniref:ribosomal-processing cysteine protease Prp n=1 Tax=Alicyclobacillus herbarius TaxID=122960 RepID=UPI0004121943|nr:ribosomal-processing cysteine protease Prp [Alicyclobacillus herbarius]MCL6631624.1 ribosomal-processing cysteine protease Prp [Alicyclobacillus herbarius]